MWECVCQRGRDRVHVCMFFQMCFMCIVKLFIFKPGSQHFIQTEFSSTRCSIKCRSISAQLPDHLSFFSLTLLHYLYLSLAPTTIYLPIYLCQSYRKQTWQWQASPSRQRERKLSTSLSRLWPWGSASCTEFNWWGCYLGRQGTRCVILTTDHVLDFL